MDAGRISCCIEALTQHLIERWDGRIGIDSVGGAGDAMSATDWFQWLVLVYLVIREVQGTP